MKLSILAVAVTLSTCMMAQSTQAPSSRVVHSSGAFVYMYSPGAGGSQVWLYASHTDRPSVATFLQFDIFTPNPDGSFTDTFGFGDVPEDVITGSTAKSLTLHVDTSQASSFETMTCTSNGVCERGPFGLIQIDFTADGGFSSRNISENHYEFFQAAERSHYDYRAASALANGSILGHSVNNGSGQIGTNRGTTITLTRKR
jgi:hypothetical protein